MHKTTVYIPDDLKRALSHLAEVQGISEAELIRQALRVLILQSSPPPPVVPLFNSGKPSLAERVDEALAGFGQD
ncbi:MAG TPA: CopG family transcriptional regulator [Candidatus Obscuribacterales bacterium]